MTSVSDCGAEAMAVRDQLGANRGKVVDLAVEDGPDRAVFVGQRLIAGREIDDAQPSVAEAYPWRDVEASLVGSTMRDDVGHRAKHVAVDEVQRIEVEASGDAAHALGRPPVCHVFHNSAISARQVPRRRGSVPGFV